MSLETRIENCEFAILKAALSAINEATLKGIDKLRIIGVKKLDMGKSLTTAVEAIAEKYGEDKIPEKSLLLYNDLHIESESPLDKSPEKTSKPKATKPKAPADAKPKKPPIEKDKYGTQPNTLARSFINSIKTKPMTMDDVRKADWNPKGYHFNDTVKRLCEAGLAKVADDGIISITE